MAQSTRRMISVSENVYQALKRRGYAGDSFDYVLSNLLKNERKNRKIQLVPELRNSRHTLTKVGGERRL